MADKNTAEILRALRERNLSKTSFREKLSNPVKMEDLKKIADNAPQSENKTPRKKKESKPKPAGKGTGKKRGPYKPRKPKQ
jgi:hypothetical protein